GPLFVRAVTLAHTPWLTWAAMVGGGAQLATQTLKFLWMSRSETFELRASALLLSGRLQNALLARLAVLVLAGIVLPLFSSPAAAVAALAIALAGEWLGR